MLVALKANHTREIHTKDNAKHWLLFYYPKYLFQDNKRLPLSVHLKRVCFKNKQQNKR